MGVKSGLLTLVQSRVVLNTGLRDHQLMLNNKDSKSEGQIISLPTSGSINSLEGFFGF